jgi:hypothetical protein
MLPAAVAMHALLAARHWIPAWRRNREEDKRVIRPDSNPATLFCPGQRAAIFRVYSAAV